MALVFDCGALFFGGGGVVVAVVAGIILISDVRFRISDTWYLSGRRNQKFIIYNLRTPKSEIINPKSICGISIRSITCSRIS